MSGSSERQPQKIVDTVATVERNELITSGSSRRYGLVRLKLDQPIRVLPGQFAMLKAHGIYEPLLRRAMAFYRSEPSGKATSVEFIYQILGRGTKSLAKLERGDQVEMLGPLGNTFDLRLAEGREVLPPEVLLVAGGVGSPALFMLAEELVARGIRTRLFIGGASHGDLCGLNDFTDLLSKEHVICATIDGSFGERGFVTAPMEKFLQARGDTPAIIYSCGPDAMLHRVAQIAERYGVPAQLSLEAPMGCGYGVCVGCAVAVKAGGGLGDSSEGFVYKKVCTDGPIFSSEELHWL